MDEVLPHFPIGVFLFSFPNGSVIHPLAENQTLPAIFRLRSVTAPSLYLKGGMNTN